MKIDPVLSLLCASDIFRVFFATSPQHSFFSWEPPPCIQGGPTPRYHCARNLINAMFAIIIPVTIFWQDKVFLTLIAVGHFVTVLQVLPYIYFFTIYLHIFLQRFRCDMISCFVVIIFFRFSTSLSCFGENIIIILYMITFYSHELSEVQPSLSNVDRENSNRQPWDVRSVEVLFYL